MFNFIKNISPIEIAVVALLLILLFGARAVVGLGKASGETVKEIKKVKREFVSALEGKNNEPSKS